MTSTPTLWSVPGASEQRCSFEDRYGRDTHDLAELHATRDPLVSYLRDRRLDLGFREFLSIIGSDRAVEDLIVLVVCAGIGGEGAFFVGRGCGRVLVADFSHNAMAKAARTPGLIPLVGDSERLPVADRSIDLVVVQDGLHHLRQPTVGFTEMLRVARHGVLVIEPHSGLVARALGTEWERGRTAPDVVNFVFRWDAALVEQVLRSYLLREPVVVRPLRVWDHRRAMTALVRRVPLERARPRLARVVYAVLQRVAGPFGNMMVAVVVRDPPPEAMAEGRRRGRFTAGVRRLRRPPPYAAGDGVAG
jgi:ubiquinone/menaquinone biosynthesis C-methylase UbiE